MYFESPPTAQNPPEIPKWAETPWKFPALLEGGGVSSNHSHYYRKNIPHWGHENAQKKTALLATSSATQKKTFGTLAFSGFLWVSGAFRTGVPWGGKGRTPQKTALNHQGSSSLKRSLELGNSLSQGQGTFMTLSVPYNRIAQKICLLVGLLNSEPLRNPWCRQGCHLQALPMCLSPQGPRHLHHRA